MTTSSREELPFRGYSLLPSARFIVDECGICKVTGVIHSGYFCNDPTSWFHKKCVELPSEINHPFHQQHPLLLTNDLGDRPCDLCGQKRLESAGYSCSTCDFNVDLTCGIKPSPPVIEHHVCHDHPLVFLKKREEETPCELCKDSIGGPSYSCLECNNVYFHLERGKSSLSL